MDVQGRGATFKPRCPGRGKGETVQGYCEGANSEGANFNFLHRGWVEEGGMEWIFWNDPMVHLPELCGWCPVIKTILRLQLFCVPRTCIMFICSVNFRSLGADL